MDSPDDSPDEMSDSNQNSEVSQEDTSSDVDETAEVEDNTAEVEGDAEQADQQQQTPPDDPQIEADANDIADRLEQLIPGVLDTAEATNNAADVSRQAAAALETGLQQLQQQEQQLMAVSRGNAQLSGRVLIGSVAALLVALGLFSFMAFQLSDRVTKVDAMIVAVSKRVVEMNSALSTFEAIDGTIGELAVQQQKFAANQLALAKAINETQIAARDLKGELPSATAEAVAEQTNTLTQQIAALEQSLDSQIGASSNVSAAVTKLGKRIGTLEGKLQNINQLNADLEALIKLERDNYLQVLRRQADLEAARQRSEQGGTVIADPTIVVYPIHAQYQSNQSSD